MEIEESVRTRARALYVAAAARPGGWPVGIVFDSDRSYCHGVGDYIPGLSNYKHFLKVRLTDTHIGEEFTLAVGTYGRSLLVASGDDEPTSYNLDLTGGYVVDGSKYSSAGAVVEDLFEPIVTEGRTDS